MTLLLFAALLAATQQELDAARNDALSAQASCDNERDPADTSFGSIDAAIDWYEQANPFPQYTQDWWDWDSAIAAARDWASDGDGYYGSGDTIWQEANANWNAAEACVEPSTWDDAVSYYNVAAIDYALAETEFYNANANFNEAWAVLDLLETLLP